jgi:hypothetical protein
MEEEAMTVLQEIAAEREKQNTKGWTPDHDDTHAEGELALAAALYASPKKLVQIELLTSGIHWREPWPWMQWISTGHDERGSGAPTGYWRKDGDRRDYHGRRENLITAAAFIVAEIERLDRADKSPSSTPETA